MRNPDTQRGETLMESLAAILIFTFASVVMLTMLSKWHEPIGGGSGCGMAEPVHPGLHR